MPDEKPTLHPDFVEVYTLNGGKNLVVNDRRVCGPDYGGGVMGQKWNVRKSELLEALGVRPSTGEGARVETPETDALIDKILSDENPKEDWAVDAYVRACTLSRTLETALAAERARRGAAEGALRSALAQIIEGRVVLEYGTNYDRLHVSGTLAQGENSIRAHFQTFGGDNGG